MDAEQVPLCENMKKNYLPNRNLPESDEIMKITITAQSIKADALLMDTKNAAAIFNILPFESTAHRWGKEIYFDVPVELKLEDGTEILEIGAVAYWPPGKSMCIFFGPTPSSKGSEVRAYSAVGVFGRIISDATIFDAVEEGDTIRVEKADQ